MATVGSKLASHILSGLLRQGYTWGRGLCGPGERSSHCPLFPLKQRSADHLRTLPGFILEVEIVPQRRKITVYHWLQSCQRDVPKSPYRGSDDARGGRA